MDRAKESRINYRRRFKDIEYAKKVSREWGVGVSS